MAIKINRVKNEPGVKLGSLKVGDTFLYDNRVGVIVNRNGHCFALDLTTCGNFRRSSPDRPWMNGDYAGEIQADTIVLPISVELIYKVVG